MSTGMLKHATFCRNPLHPGPCARVRFDPPKGSKRHRVPPGIDVSGMNGGGWSPNDPKVAEIATIARHYGFTKMQYTPRTAVRGAWAQVDTAPVGAVFPDGTLSEGPDVLHIGDEGKWDMSPRMFRRVGASAKLPAEVPVGAAIPRTRVRLPHPRHFMMPESQGIESVAQYVIPHEAGHRDAVMRGEHRPLGDPMRYRTMADALVNWTRDNGVSAHDGSAFAPVDFTEPQTTGRLATLLRHGWSEYSIGNPSEMYGEFFAAYQLGSDDGPVVAVATAMGWTR